MQKDLNKLILIMVNFFWMLTAFFFMADFSIMPTNFKIAAGLNYFIILMYATIFVFIHKDNLSHNLLKEVD